MPHAPTHGYLYDGIKVVRDSLEGITLSGMARRGNPAELCTRCCMSCLVAFIADNRRKAIHRNSHRVDACLCMGRIAGVVLSLSELQRALLHKQVFRDNVWSQVSSLRHPSIRQGHTVNGRVFALPIPNGNATIDDRLSANSGHRVSAKIAA